MEEILKHYKATTEPIEVNRKNFPGKIFASAKKETFNISLKTIQTSYAKVARLIVIRDKVEKIKSFVKKFQNALKLYIDPSAMGKKTSLIFKKSCS